jgi:hypothetical protein
MDVYATHQQALVAAVMATKGDVLELGAGHYSTPILHEICAVQKRRLVTLEHNKNWLDAFLHLSSDSHQLLYVSDWASCSLIDSPWDCVFVDHGPYDRRKLEIERLRVAGAGILVIHDTEAPIYEVEPVMSRFKHRKDYKTLRPWTTLVSDKYSLLPAKPDISNIDYKDIPVYICNFNRLDATKRLYNWLVAAGMRKIFIVDNMSTYPPLLDWYKDSGVQVISMGANIGPWASWNRINALQDTPFVFTDSDIVPAEGCPQNLVEACLQTYLEAGPSCGKVGPGLRLDNVPENNLKTEYFKEGSEPRTLEEWEGRFWTRKRNSKISSFNAPIDTTFALYGGNATFTNGWQNIRLDFPYVVEHTPWYVSAPYTEEEIFYRNTVRSGIAVANAKVF